MTGLETALPIVHLTMVQTGKLNWEDVARVMSSNPAKIGRVSEGPTAQGRPLAEGEPANIVLYNPQHTITVDPAAQATMSDNSPFQGMQLPGRVEATFLRGRATVLHAQPVPTI